jgi:hypothetical protein
VTDRRTFIRTTAIGLLAVAGTANSQTWLDHFHGGTTPAEKVHSFWMGGIVAASEYIGPVKKER